MKKLLKYCECLDKCRLHGVFVDVAIELSAMANYVVEGSDGVFHAAVSDFNYWLQSALATYKPTVHKQTRVP